MTAEPQALGVACLDIVNTTGEAVLESGLGTALQISLEQSTYVNVLSPERVRQALKRRTLPSP